MPTDASDEALDAFFGTNEWRSMGRRMQVDWVGLYRKQLVKLGYVDTVPAHDLIVLNSKNVPFYQMCFFSKSATGYKLWDNVTAIDAKGQRWLGTG